MRAYLCFYLLLTVVFISCTKSESTAPTNPTGSGGTGNANNPPPTTGSSSTAATIVIIGSSTAAGKGAAPSDSGWVNRLRLATIDNKKSLYFINLAVVGFTTYEGMPNGYMKENRPAADTAKNITKALAYRPSLVVISYPTNDVAANYTDDEIMGNYKEMVRLLDSAKVNYLIVGTQPRDFADDAQRTRLKTLNGKIKATYSDHMDDVFDSLSTSDLHIKPSLSAGDGAHLNNAGHYLIMQSVLTNAIFQSMIK